METWFKFKIFYFNTIKFIINIKLNLTRFIDGKTRDDNGVGWGGVGLKDGVFVPTPHGFVLSHPRPASPRMTEKTFSPHPRPLEPREAPPHPVKLYILLICLTTSTIFLMKPISLTKIYLKLQLIYPIKSNQFLEKIE